MLSVWLKLVKEVLGLLFSSTEAEWLKPIQRIAHRVARFLSLSFQQHRIPTS
jgi:hypothetical protein